MQPYDYAIIGGGIVGLSVAWSIQGRQPRARVLVLEKENGWGHHQTGRNSGVIHSGIYYKPGSLKAKLCREGNRRMVEFCDLHGIRHEICGKVIVATTESELPRLEKLYVRGVENGLEVKKMAVSQVKELEPHVSCVGGLHVPSTGIVSYLDVCRKLVELISARGGEARTNTQVHAFRSSGDAGVLETSNGSFAAHWIISCAGLQSDRIARLTGAEPEVRIVPFRGEYYELKPERRGLVRNLIYPVPDPALPFLGVHFTRMIDGSIHAGPNAVLSLKREGYHRFAFNAHDFVDTMTYGGFWRMAAKHAKSGLEEMHRSFSKKAFVRSLQKLIPEVVEEDLVPSQAGVRAQALQRDGGLVDDFLIIRHGRALHVCNAPSPAATASLEIGRTIADQLPLI
jgi:L-2-hydroxyglutarate oxidase